MFFSRHITRNTLTYGQTEFVLAGSLKRKKRHNSLLLQLVMSSLVAEAGLEHATSRL